MIERLRLTGSRVELAGGCRFSSDRNLGTVTCQKLIYTLLLYANLLWLFVDTLGGVALHSTVSCRCAKHMPENQSRESRPGDVSASGEPR